MNPEERLDAAVEHLMRHQPAILTTPEETALLAEVHHVTEVQALPVPPDFTTLLEGRLRQRAQELRATPTVAPRTASPARPRWVSATVSVGIVGILVMGGWGILTASAHSVPGDPLYGIKQWQQQISLDHTTQPVQHAQLQVQALDASITDLATELAHKRAAADIAAAFRVVVSATQQAQQAVQSLSPADQATVSPALQQAQAREVKVLYTVLAPLPLTERAAVTTQLGVLGEAVPHITQVAVTHERAGQVLLVVMGEHFAPGAALLLDGTVLIPSTATPTQLSVTMATNTWGGQAHQIGVQNPDGTTALTSADDPAQGTTATPSPDKGNVTPTPTNDPNGHRHATPTPGIPHH